LVEPLVEVVDGHGLADVVALDGVAAQRGQFVPGALVLDAFGDDPQASRPGR